MNVLDRITRHARLTVASYVEPKSPPFLILFVNSTCNQKCEHCFFWRSLNQRDDLTRDELFALSEDLGAVENLNLSGGEPFMRRDLGDICRKFIRTNGVKQIYVPTNAYWTKKMVAQISETLKEPGLELFVAEFSLDGLGATHDRFRGSPGSFRKAMESYEALAELQRSDPRVRIHANSVVTEANVEEVKRLTTFLFDRCPQMDHQNLALIRGDRKNPSLRVPDLEQYRELYDYVRRLWAPREQERYGSLVEPMLQWAKARTVERKMQFVPCRAGALTGVVYANGDVSACELHEPLGNLRQAPFTEIWSSEAARRLRASIACKEGWCTTEVFMWPSINFQPLHLARALLGATPWRKVEPLDPGEKVSYSVAEPRADGEREGGQE